MGEILLRTRKDCKWFMYVYIYKHIYIYTYMKIKRDMVNLLLRETRRLRMTYICERGLQNTGKRHIYVERDLYMLLRETRRLRMTYIRIYIWTYSYMYTYMNTERHGWCPIKGDGKITHELYKYIYIYIYICMYILICIFIYIERERERDPIERD